MLVLHIFINIALYFNAFSSQFLLRNKAQVIWQLLILAHVSNILNDAIIFNTHFNHECTWQCSPHLPQVLLYMILVSFVNAFTRIDTRTRPILYINDYKDKTAYKLEATTDICDYIYIVAYVTRMEWEERWREDPWCRRFVSDCWKRNNQVHPTWFQSSRSYSLFTNKSPINHRWSQ